MLKYIHTCFFFILLAGLTANTAAAAPLEPGSQTIRFSGQSWTVINSVDLRGPGPNIFDARNVHLDEQGRLVMETSFRDGRWTSAHVFLSRSLGYGTYRIVLAPFRKPLDVMSVFGFFTWDDNPDYANREIDIELARWGQLEYPNLNFTVQPWEGYPERHWSGNFDFSGQTILEFEWKPDGIRFKTASGLGLAEWFFPEAESRLTAPFVVPPKGRERLGINLWLYQGQAPSEADRIVIEEFSFVRWTRK